MKTASIKIGCNDDGCLHFRFFVFACAMPMHSLRFVWGSEFLSGKWRASLATAFLNLTFVPAIMSLPLVIQLFMDSFKFQLFMASLYLPALVVTWLVPESPRWLIAMKKLEQAGKVLTTGAKFNKRPVPKKWNFPPAKDETRWGKDSFILIHLNTVLLSQTQHLVPVQNSQTSKIHLGSVPDHVWAGLCLLRNSFELGQHRRQPHVEHFHFWSGAYSRHLLCQHCHWDMEKKGCKTDLCSRFFMASVFFTPQPFTLAFSAVTSGLLIATAAFEKGVYAYDWPIVAFSMLGHLVLVMVFSSMYS